MLSPPGSPLYLGEQDARSVPSCTTPCPEDHSRVPWAGGLGLWLCCPVLSAERVWHGALVVLGAKRASAPEPGNWSEVVQPQW